MKDKDMNTGEPDLRFTVEQPNEGPDPVETLKNIAKRESEAAKKAVAKGEKRPNEDKAGGRERTNEDEAGTKDTATDELPTLKEAIMEQATESDAPLTSNLTFMKIIGGDILNTAIIRRQIWLFVLIAFFMLLYISNRYSCQQDIIEIDHLQTQLQDAKYKALSSNSQLTEKSRESNVLNELKNNKDSVLKMASQPPYIINVPEEK